MSVAVKVPYTITYNNPQAQPPVFLAGSFTNPPWLQQEMESSIDDHGDHVFQATVLVEPATNYHFKFKTGNQDEWIVDESKPVAENENGQRSNFLNVPLEHHARRQSQEASSSSSTFEIAGVNQGTSTPIDQVAATAAEVADAAEKLDGDDASPPQVSASGGESENEDDLRTPLFAHECFGAYAFVDDGLDHDTLESQQRRDSRTKSADVPDLNDPTLEKFPSERTSVLDTLRNIQSSLGENHVQIDDPNLRRSSLDSTDDGALSAGSLSPPTMRRRDKRASMGSLRKRSLASLGSIAEEPKPPQQQQQNGSLMSATKSAEFDDNETLLMSNIKIR